jgi:fatty acid-binding protein DegV
MTVHVVTDSGSCLPPALAEEYGITVLDLHTSGVVSAKAAVEDATTEGADGADSADSADSTDGVDGGDTSPATEKDGDTESAGVEEAADDAESAGDTGDTGDTEENERPTTSALGPLELTAAYARLLERGGDEGVVAIHLSKELSSTWSSAVQAAGIFDGKVSVIDTRSAGMVLGQAAIAAATASANGGTLAECAAAAQEVVDGSHVWLVVSHLDLLSRGGRLSTGQRLLSTALAIKPILHLSQGKLEVAAKTRTRSKSLERLVLLAEDAYREIAEPPQEDPQAEQPEDARRRRRRRQEERTPLRQLPAVPMHLAVHQVGDEESAEHLRRELRDALPECVVISMVDITPAIAVHTGAGAIGVTLVKG